MLSWAPKVICLNGKRKFITQRVCTHFYGSKMRYKDVKVINNRVEWGLLPILRNKNSDARFGRNVLILIFATKLTYTLIFRRFFETGFEPLVHKFAAEIFNTVLINHFFILLFDLFSFDLYLPHEPAYLSRIFSWPNNLYRILNN